MPRNSDVLSAPLAERIRERLGERALAIGLALAIEALIGLALLTLGASAMRDERKPEPRLVSFAARSSNEREKPKEPDVRPEPRRAATGSPPQPRPAPEPQAARAAPSRAAIIPLSRSDLAASDIAKPAPKSSGRSKPVAGPLMGPPGPAAMADTPRVGTGPQGQPLYAAAWYREPYDDELSGYLSTASGPGWGLIACRTAPDFRVEDCVTVDEYPAGSNIARAVVAAAWQFRVRPPRVGGVPQVGDWVRIRIDYGNRPR